MNKEKSESYFELIVKFKKNTNLQKHQEDALELFSCLGICEGVLSEEEIDEHLGNLSLCGGNLPIDSMDELEETLLTQKSTFYFNDENSAKKCLDFFKQSNVLEEGIILEKKTEDWNTSWRENFKKITIESINLDIIPSWEDVSKETSYIKIYPGQGFGTGNHETTHSCLSMLSELNVNSIENFLDFGCGSGILGVGLQYLNPSSKGVYYDIDEDALENTVQNLELNQIENFELYAPKEKNKIKKLSYDLVFANILAPVLKVEREFLRSLSFKKIILSGLLSSQLEDILGVYADEKLIHVKTLIKGDWATVLLELK